MGFEYTPNTEPRGTDIMHPRAMYTANRYLKPTDIPPAGADLTVIGRFAEGFDPAGHWKRIWKSEYFANAQKMLTNAFKAHAESGTLPTDLTELRTCLTLQWEVLRFSRGDPLPEQERFFRALLDKIREVVSTDRRG